MCDRVWREPCNCACTSLIGIARFLSRRFLSIIVAINNFAILFFRSELCHVVVCRGIINFGVGRIFATVGVSSAFISILSMTVLFSESLDFGALKHIEDLEVLTVFQLFQYFLGIPICQSDRGFVNGCIYVSFC